MLIFTDYIGLLRVLTAGILLRRNNEILINDKGESVSEKLHEKMNFTNLLTSCNYGKAMESALARAVFKI
jgi:hypothetical protein